MSDRRPARPAARAAHSAQHPTQASHADTGAPPPTQAPATGAHSTVSGRAVMLARAVPVDGVAVWALAAGLTLALVIARARSRAISALGASEARLRAIFDHAAVGIVVQGEDGQIQDANPAFQQLVRYTLPELRAMRPSDFVPPEDAEAVDELPALTHALGGGQQVTVEQRFRRRDGALRRCELTVSRVSSGRALVGLVQDVTHHRELQDELHFRAYHDPLTRLANRARFRERAAAALEAGGDAGVDAVAVLLVDLDGFKLVNDTAGHAAGDALLVEVSKRLLNATRGCDVVARLGGDEFGVLLTNVGGDADAYAVADRIISSVQRPIAVDGTNARVGASIGIARGGHLAAEPVDAAEPLTQRVNALLRDADLALYAAKDAGKGRAVTFAPDMHAAFVERLSMEAALREALERREFRLVYQPIVELAGGAIMGVEALVRWEHPTRGVVTPAEFVPVAEETGLIVPIGRWVLEEACRAGGAWQRALAADGQAARPFSVAVNVSGRQLARGEFVGEVESALAAAGLAPGRLTLELTESTVVHHPEAVRRRLESLRALGVRLAIDDFGTGYSALSYLRQFPIDVLKVDKSFVDPVAGGGQAAALAGAIVALGGALGLRTVAEGIESAEQAERLGAMGCALGQGFYFAAPLDPAEVGEALAVGGEMVAAV